MKLVDPLIKQIGSVSGGADDCSATMNQQCSQMLAAPRGHAHQHAFVVAGVLAGNEAEPGNEVATVPEFGTAPDCGNDRRPGLRAGALDPGKAPEKFGLLEHTTDFSLEECDPPIQIEKEIMKFANGLARQIGEFVVKVGENFRKYSSCAGNALAESEAPIQQEPTDLGNDGGPMVHHPLARLVSAWISCCSTDFLGTKRM